MRRKILCFGLIATIAMGLLSGCNNNSSSVDNTVETTTPSNDEGVVQGGYAYEQELNIIDDNYRNYYEIFVYSFCDSDGDGIGDLNGVTQKLDYIADMGFNGIWLMPIMPSTTYHKYDVTDYYNVDPEYGTIEDFEKLIEECDKRGIKLIIDLVMNHSSSQHQWFTDAKEYLQTVPEGAEPDSSVCPYVDYYHFSTEQGGSGWYKVPNSNYYFEGVFWSEMPDLNLENEAVKKEFENIAKFWIDLGVDGFRMDAVMHFSETDKQFNIDTISWFYDYCLTLDPEFYMVSEVWAGQPTIESYYASSIPSYFDFAFADSEGTLINVGRGGTKASVFVNKMYDCQVAYSAQNPDYIDAPFITNHDMGRVANALLNKEENLKMTAGLLLTMSGSPFVYYGEEIGMKSSGTKDENKRLPMIWSKSDLTGVTDGPAAADAGIESAFPGVDEQLENEYSILNYYKRGLRIRNENPEIARGEIKVIDSLCDGHQAAITKTWEDSTIGIVYNSGETELTVDLNGSDLENMAIRGYLTINGEIITLTEGKLVMPAKSICILK